MSISLTKILNYNTDHKMPVAHLFVQQEQYKYSNIEVLRGYQL